MNESADTPAEQGLNGPRTSKWTWLLFVFFASSVSRLLRETLAWPRPIAFFLPWTAALIALYFVVRSPVMSFGRWCVEAVAILALGWLGMVVLPYRLLPSTGPFLAFAMPFFTLALAGYWVPPLTQPRTRSRLRLWVLIAAVGAIAVGGLAELRLRKVANDRVAATPRRTSA